MVSKANDKKLEEYKRTALKYGGKNEFDRADMDDLRASSRPKVDDDERTNA